MPKKVYNNVEGHRMIVDGMVAEDVTSVGLPSVEHPTSTISSSGMAMDVDMPNTTHINAMEMTVNHNNGENCSLLSTPGKHNLEFRTVRQRYNVPKGTLEHESVKFRCVVVHKSTEDGTIELGNPYGSTVKFSVLRYEKEVNGKVVMLVDAMTGDIKINGKNYSEQVESLLN